VSTIGLKEQFRRYGMSRSTLRATGLVLVRLAPPPSSAGETCPLPVVTARTSTRRHQTENPSTRAGVSKRKTCASPSSTLFREKDQNFVAALIRSALVDRDTILTRPTSVEDRYRAVGEEASAWLWSLQTGKA
jgi:hypothetical protein